MSNNQQIIVPTSRNCEQYVQHNSIVSLQAENGKWWYVGADNRIMVKSGDGADDEFRFKVELEKTGMVNLRALSNNKLVYRHYEEVNATAVDAGQHTRFHPIVHTSSGWSLGASNDKYLGRYLQGGDFIMANKDDFDAHTGFAVRVILEESEE